MTRGMILAAGLGERLRPLTDQLPKPLLPVANEPVMAQGLRTLRRLGITEVCANVCYRGEQVMEAFGNGSAYGVDLEWIVEPRRSGSAGGMKAAQYFLQDSSEIVVIAGDAMLDLDLGPLLAGHRACRALATVGVLHVAEPWERYGVVTTDANHRLLQFQEKPRRGEEISHLANTAIYIFDPAIFDLIPADEVCDFAQNVFTPARLQEYRFCAFPVEGYWTDIGNPHAYLEANLDYLHGRIRISGSGERRGSNCVDADAVVEGCALTDCVIGRGAILAPSSRLTRCVVWPQTQLREPVELTEAVLTPQATYRITAGGAELVRATDARVVPSA